MTRGQRAHPHAVEQLVPKPASPPAPTRGWLSIPTTKQINAAQEESDPASVLNYIRALLKLRSHTLAFVYGDYQDLDPQNEKVLQLHPHAGRGEVPRCRELQLHPGPHTLCRMGWRLRRFSCPISQHPTKRMPQRSILRRGRAASTSNSRHGVFPLDNSMANDQNLLTASRAQD